jgi:hypothetical protein
MIEKSVLTKQFQDGEKDANALISLSNISPSADKKTGKITVKEIEY